MKNKILLLLMLFGFACFGVARAEEVFVGAATTAINYLPSNCYYNYSMTQQIYTADEIGTSGLISSISFYCTTCSANRTLDIYLVSTEKTTFSSITSTSNRLFVRMKTSANSLSLLPIDTATVGMAMPSVWWMCRRTPFWQI